jgi:23S rRNA (pseudouridine1915-N3)-methyltransferase
MKVTLLLTGKTSVPYLKTGMDDYGSRLTHYMNFKVVELKDSEKILKSLKPSDYVVLLDERGKSYSSVDWAQHLESFFVHSQRDLVFAIGGPFGFSPEEYKRADEMLSLSQMTFSHQLVRLIFMEQLYRAMTIIKGEPYHHQ